MAIPKPPVLTQRMLPTMKSADTLKYPWGRGEIASATHNSPNTNADILTDAYELLAMLGSRMRWHHHQHPPAPFRYIAPIPVSDQLVAVIVVRGNDYVVVEDDGHLYPSDALITKLRAMT